MCLQASSNRCRCSPTVCIMSCVVRCRRCSPAFVGHLLLLCHLTEQQKVSFFGSPDRFWVQQLEGGTGTNTLLSASLPKTQSSSFLWARGTWAENCLGRQTSSGRKSVVSWGESDAFAALPLVWRNELLCVGRLQRRWWLAPTAHSSRTEAELPWSAWRRTEGCCLPLFAKHWQHHRHEFPWPFEASCC